MSYLRVPGWPYTYTIKKHILYVIIIKKKNNVKWFVLVYIVLLWLNIAKLHCGYLCNSNNNSELLAHKTWSSNTDFYCTMIKYWYGIIQFFMATVFFLFYFFETKYYMNKQKTIIHLIRWNCYWISTNWWYEIAICLKSYC